jgi:hypothetical protein
MGRPRGEGHRARSCQGQDKSCEAYVKGYLPRPRAGEYPRLMRDDELAGVLEAFVKELQARPRKESNRSADRTCQADCRTG